MDYASNNINLSREKLDKLINDNSLINNVFDKEIGFDLSKMRNNEESKAIWQESLNVFNENYIKNRKNYYKIFDLLIDNTPNIDTKEINGFSPLIFATEINDKYLVKRLLERDANPDFYNDGQYRAYDYAELNKNEELMELLY